MIDLRVFDLMSDDQNKTTTKNKSHFGTVVEMNGTKAKVLIDGDTEALESFLSCIATVNVGDRVLLHHAGVEIIVLGAIK